MLIATFLDEHCINMSWIIAQAEHIGGRREQQDRSLARVSADGQRCWLVLADGMGGHSGGAMASQAIVDTALQLWNVSQEGLLINEPAVFLWQFFTTAQQNICLIANRQHLDPHSTCVAALLTPEDAWFTHLGDSRLYHFRQQKFFRRTKDHSFVQLLVDMGKVREEDMASHREQNSLYQGLGGTDKEALDLEIQHARLQKGDSFLLCSDGFWGQVSLEQMEKLFQEPFEVNLSQAVEKAVKNGGIYCDNISVITAILI